jgi:hypothetical protein
MTKFGFVWFGRHLNGIVMCSELLIRWIQIRFKATGFSDATFEVIGNHQLRLAPKELKTTGMAHDPVFQALTPGHFSIAVIRCPHDGQTLARCDILRWLDL